MLRVLRRSCDHCLNRNNTSAIICKPPISIAWDSQISQARQGSRRTFRFPILDSFSDTPHQTTRFETTQRLHSRHCIQLTRQLKHNISSQSKLCDSLESRVFELERVTTHRRLNKQDIQSEIWPILNECAAKDLFSDVETCISKAKLSNRLLELCLKEVDQYRIYLWQWLGASGSRDLVRKDETVEMESHGVFDQMYNFAFSKETSITEREETSDFSPSAYWKNAPHPSKEMYNLAFSSWKNVIESTHSSTKNSIETVEKAARHVSSLLSTMEDDYSTEAEFITAYNDAVDSSRYATLKVGAALPDVTTYGEVMNTWGQCVGSFARQTKSRNLDDNDSFEARLRLEASAIKAIMELKESMEDDFSQFFDDSAVENISTRYRRPRLDKPCYNIILATMARQINPSLAEMRLVIQQMMERVMHDVENSDIEFDEDYPDSHPSMECFPDVVSYNALVEARASRSAMFASAFQTKHENNNSDSHSIVVPHHKWDKSLWQKLRNQNEQEKSNVRRRREFTASEEEAIFSEQVIDEMCNLATVSVRPNVWSYNSVIKSWVNTQTDRGLQRAILILRALTMGQNSVDGGNEEYSSSLSSRLSEMSLELLTKKTSFKAVNGELLELEKIASTYTKRFKQQNQTHLAFNPRMALLNTTMTGNDDLTTHDKESSKPIGALPYIEPSVSPDLRSFKIVVGALERHGTMISAKLSMDLLRLLEDQCLHLNPDTSIYNSVLNAWAKAGKESNNAELAMYAAKQAQELLNEMIVKSTGADNAFPGPNDSSFLMVINAYAGAAALMAYPLSIHAAKQAEELSRELIKQPPQHVDIAISCLGIVARTWARLSGNPGFKSKVRHSDQAYGAIEKMVELSNGMRLDILPFNAVLDAWARELAAIQKQHKSQDAIATLTKMHEFLMRMLGEHKRPFNVNPDRSSFNHMIRACYVPYESKSLQVDVNTLRQALEFALNTYSQMNHSTHRPDAHTYLHLLKAIHHLVPGDENDNPRRFKLLKSIFEDCCDHGYLSKTTFWTVHSNFHKDQEYIDLLHSLTGIHRDQLSTMYADELFTLLPREWSRFGCRVKALNKFVKGRKKR